MKKRIGYFLLIVIAIVGSRLLYGINYDLNNETEVITNLYRYDIINNLLSSLVVSEVHIIGGLKTFFVSFFFPCH